MPKEMITIELRRSPGQPWGMRIGGGVDRGKVLVLEKVRKYFLSFTFVGLHSISDLIKSTFA